MRTAHGRFASCRPAATPPPAAGARRSEEDGSSQDNAKQKPAACAKICQKSNTFRPRSTKHRLCRRG
eukprot:8976192-Pyramimonas_sp.AAC.1